MTTRTRINPLTRANGNSPPALDTRHITTASLAAELHYDYSRIADPDDRAAVKATAMRIKPRLKRVVRDVLDSGADLNAIRAQIPHGQWGDWLETEFELSETMARNWMNAAEKFGGNSANFADLPLSALYQLAAPSTPPAAIAIVEQQITNGQPVTVKQVKEAITSARIPRCKRCGRNLTNADAIAAGIGPCCARKPVAGATATDDDSTEDTVIDDETSERQRLQALHNALVQAYMLLANPDHKQTAEDYCFGQEMQRLIADTNSLRDEIRKLTPEDRIQ